MNPRTGSKSKYCSDILLLILPGFILHYTGAFFCMQTCDCYPNSPALYHLQCISPGSHKTCESLCHYIWTNKFIQTWTLFNNGNSNSRFLSLEKGVVKLCNSLAHNMAVHLLSSHTATFSNIITLHLSSNQKQISHSFLPSFLSTQFTLSAVNILIEWHQFDVVMRQWESEEKRGDYSRPAASPRCTQVTALVRLGSLASCWSVHYTQIKPYSGRDQSPILLQWIAYNIFFQLKSAQMDG